MKKILDKSLLLIISVLMILICLLIPVMKTNAWFTAGENQKIQIVINIKNLNLNVYQKISSTETLIKTYDENETDDEKSYVDLTDGNGSREILPDTSYSLNLILKNDDIGSNSLYVRYKIELYINSTVTDTLLSLNLSGQDNAFTLNGGYYYYFNSTGSEQQYPAGKSLNMCTSFSIPYSEFINNDINADNVKLVVTVEGYDAKMLG